MHAEAVGSVMHPLSAVTWDGMEDDPLYVPVHPVAEGSVRHALTVVMSLVRVETEPNCAGMEEAALK